MAEPIMAPSVSSPLFLNPLSLCHVSLSKYISVKIFNKNIGDLLEISKLSKYSEGKETEMVYMAF